MDELVQYHDCLFQLAFRYTRNRTRAEDLVQDTYLRAIKAWDRFDGKNIRAWLCTILMRRFFSNYRKNKLEHAYLERIKHSYREDHTNNEQITDLNEVGFKETLSDDTMNAINTLTDQHRDVLVMADLNDVPYKEIGQKVGCPMGTVLSRVHRARNNFRKVYKTP